MECRQHKSGLKLLWLIWLLSATPASAINFTIAGGQIFTPGLAIVDAPQPGTPLGGDELHVALDVSTNGRLPLQTASDSPTQFHNVTVFLYSYDTRHNFTVSNGTASANNASLGRILAQEPGSTVKHVNWVWPDCLVGDGQPSSVNSARGVYNISIRQNFRLNNVNYYTIFDLPISVTNSISSSIARPGCSELENPLLSPEEINVTAANSVGVLFAPGDATQVDVKGMGDLSTQGNGLGASRPEAQPSDGLGSDAAGNLRWLKNAHWLLWTFAGGTGGAVAILV